MQLAFVGASDQKMFSQSEKDLRYRNCEMCEVSDPELWMKYHHGESPPSCPPTDDPEISDGEKDLYNTMRETNLLLTAREQPLEVEWDETEARHEIDAPP